MVMSVDLFVEQVANEIVHYLSCPVVVKSGQIVYCNLQHVHVGPNTASVDNQHKPWE